MNENNDTNDELDNPTGDNAKISGVNEISGANKIPGFNEIPGVEETPDPAGGANDINPNAAFPPFPPPPDTKDVTIIQHKIKQVFVKDMLEGGETPGIDVDTSKAKNYNNDNNNANNITAINDNDEYNDNNIFHPGNPLPSDKR